jgi:hypothetical protein
MTGKLTPPDCPTRTRLWRLWGTTELDLSQVHSTPPRSGAPVLRQRRYAWLVTVLAALCLGNHLCAAVFGREGLVAAATLLTPSRSTTITITPDNQRLLVVNR